jgi:hypothetical protein
VKRVTRECNSASRIRESGKRDANIKNATRPRLKGTSPGVGAEISPDRQKTILFNAILAKWKLFLIIHELSVPDQTAVNGSLLEVNEKLRTQPQQIPLWRASLAECSH